MKKEKKKKHSKSTLPDEVKTSKEESCAAYEKAVDPLKYAVSVIGGKWKIRVLWVLRNGNPMRYREIKQLVSGITDMMLSQSLHELTACGLIQRHQYNEIPPKVEYNITNDGKNLIPAIKLIFLWAQNKLSGSNRATL